MLTSDRSRAHLMQKNIFLIAVTLALAAFITALSAQADEAQETRELKERLQKFKANPKLQMQVLPVKKFVEGDAAKVIFKQDSIAGKKFVEYKDKTRQTFCKTTAVGIEVCVKDGNGRAGIQDNDRAEDLVDLGRDLEKNLAAMDSPKLRQGKLKTQPWSDNYWPIYQGILGARYTHPELPSSDKFPDFLNFKDSQPVMSFLETRRSSPVSANMLSPSEKYDLLVGDASGMLTKQMWAQGEDYQRSNGKVETWMGICHGRAPAAYMVPRPKNAVSVPVKVNVNGEEKEVEITFYPSDIKALSSYLWATSRVNSRFIGGRCNKKEPRTTANGRVKDEDCFDTNPGAWHKVVVNQIGQSKRSFVMDATFDYEVWNQPVYSYKYSYFNPRTLQPVKTLKEATEPYGFRGDKFAKERKNPDAKSIVGISMEVTYIVETQPTKSLTDSSRHDAKTSVTYEYDLELDRKGDIIGGEWYTNAHPDFLWTPGAEDAAQSDYDLALTGSWDGKSELPPDWKIAAKRAAAQGDVLANVVNGLVKAAQKK